MKNLITNRTEWPTISEYKHNFDFSWLQLYTENTNKSCYRTVAPRSVGLISLSELCFYFGNGVRHQPVPGVITHVIVDSDFQLADLV